MSLNMEQTVGVRFDQFDRFVETLIGKYTLQHTVYMAYQ